MDIPLNLTPVQQSDILHALRSFWPNAIQASIVAVPASKLTLAAWQLHGEHKNHQPYENLALIITDPQLILEDDGVPRFNCAKLEFIYENGRISHGIPSQQCSVTHPTTLITLLSPNELRGAFQELRTHSAKVPVRPSRAA